MTDPKVFTGPERYTFTLYEGDARPGVIVASPGAPLDQGTWIPLRELLAFMSWRDGFAPPGLLREIEAKGSAAIEADDRPNPAVVRTLGTYTPDPPHLVPLAPPRVAGPYPDFRNCACGTGPNEPWHNPTCSLYPEGGYPADQPWRGPQAHSTGGCDHNMIAVHTDGSEICRLCRAGRKNRNHPWRILGT